MNRKEAEDFVYKSYLKAEKYQNYDAKDSDKRRPDLTREIIQSKAGTPCIVVTGSKGKGSVSNMISQILQTTCKVGLMTSPHITDFCERFKVNGRTISAKDFAEQMSAIQPEIDAIDEKIPENVCISPMGVQVDLGLTYFNAQHTEFNVFECGKGAKFDDVNNVLHEYAVINSIFPEHTRELGETVEEIAEDKSHVITGEQKGIYVAQQKQSVLDVICKRADQWKIPVKIYGRDFSAENIQYTNQGMVFDVFIGTVRYEKITVPLLGKHQAENCALALALCREILGELDLTAVRENLLKLNWPGRMEIIRSYPLVMLDACVNAASCQNIIDVMGYLNIEKPTIIIGIPNDKDYAGVVRKMAAVADRIVLTRSQNPHYIFTDIQCGKMSEEGIKTTWTDSIEEALRYADRWHQPVIILGTTSVVAEVKNLQQIHYF